MYSPSLFEIKTVCVLMGKVIVLAGGEERCDAGEAVLSSVEDLLSSSRSARKPQEKLLS